MKLHLGQDMGQDMLLYLVKKIIYRDICLKLRYVHTVYQRIKMTPAKVENSKKKFEQLHLVSLIYHLAGI